MLASCMLRPSTLKVYDAFLLNEPLMLPLYWML